MSKLEKVFAENKFKSEWSDEDFPISALECSKGWHDLIANLMEDLIKLGWNKKIAQIKEKFGGLRFYIGEGTQEMFDTIHKAEAQSYKICEFCGKEGRKAGIGYWIKTLCDACERDINRE